MTKELFVVLIMPNNGGHGPWPAVVQITENAAQAVETARKIEKLGYSIDWEDGVRVDRIIPEKVYSRKDQRDDSRTIYSYQISWFNIRESKKIKEFFWDIDLAKKFCMSVAEDMLHPSEPV